MTIFSHSCSTLWFTTQRGCRTLKFSVLNNLSYIVKYLCKHKFGSLICWWLRFFSRALNGFFIATAWQYYLLATQWTKWPLHTRLSLYSLAVHTLSDTELTSRWVRVSVCWHKNIWSLKQSPTFSDYTFIVPFVASPSRVALWQRECASAETSCVSFRIRGFLCKLPDFAASAINLQPCFRYCLISAFRKIWRSRHRQTVWDFRLPPWIIWELRYSLLLRNV